MFLTRRAHPNALPKRQLSEMQNASVAKKKSFLSIVSKSKSREKSNSQERACTKGSSPSLERLRSNLGSETAIDLSNFPSEKAIIPAKRENYLHKIGKTHKAHSLLLDNTQFDQYTLEDNHRTLWNQNSPINKLIEDGHSFWFSFTYCHTSA